MDYKVNTNENLPSKPSIWSKMRSFLYQDMSEVTFTPFQEKIVTGIYDFWHKEITGESVKNFLFQEIEIIDNITL